MRCNTALRLGRILSVCSLATPWLACVLHCFFVPWLRWLESRGHNSSLWLGRILSVCSLAAPCLACILLYFIALRLTIKKRWVIQTQRFFCILFQLFVRVKGLSSLSESKGETFGGYKGKALVRTFKKQSTLCVPYGICRQWRFAKKRHAFVSPFLFYFVSIIIRW